MFKITAPSFERAEELYDLTAKVFAAGGYFEFLRYCRQSYFAGSCYDWQASRVALVGGRLVGHVGIWRYRMRVGRARLVTGGVGAVLTHPDYRRRGVGARLMRAVVRTMRAGGYQFSMLFGIRDFYHRFGFVPAWAETTVTARVEDLPSEKLRFSLRRVPLKELLSGTGAVMRLHRRDDARRTGTALRPLYRRPGGYRLAYRCHALSDDAGRVRGYVLTRRDGRSLRVAEVGGLGRGCGVRQLLAAIRTIARRDRCDRILTEHLAYGHPLCVALRGGSCTVELRHIRSGGPMARVISLRGCLEAMTGELSDRLAASALRGFSGTVLVQAVGEKVALRLGRGRVRLADPPRAVQARISAGPEIARLVLGAEPPAVLAQQGAVRFSGAAAELAEVLFPQQWPMAYGLDHF